MKSFYEFYRLLRETNGAPSGGTTTNSSANIASPPGPAQTASMGAAAVPKSSALAPPANQPTPADAAAAVKSALDAVKHIEDSLKGNPNQEVVGQLVPQVTNMTQQLDAMQKALTDMQGQLDQGGKPTEQQGKDKDAANNMAAQNASAQPPPQPPTQAPTAGMNAPAPAMGQGG